MLVAVRADQIVFTAFRVKRGQPIGRKPRLAVDGVRSPVCRQVDEFVATLSTIDSSTATAMVLATGKEPRKNQFTLCAFVCRSIRLPCRPRPQSYRHGRANGAREGRGCAHFSGNTPLLPWGPAAGVPSQRAGPWRAKRRSGTTQTSISIQPWCAYGHVSRLAHIVHHHTHGHVHVFEHGYFSIFCGRREYAPAISTVTTITAIFTVFTVIASTASSAGPTLAG